MGRRPVAAHEILNPTVADGTGGARVDGDEEKASYDLRVSSRVMEIMDPTALRFLDGSMPRYEVPGSIPGAAPPRSLAGRSGEVLQPTRGSGAHRRPHPRTERSGEVGSEPELACEARGAHCAVLATRPATGAVPSVHRRHI